MARKIIGPRKRRTREHVIADQSVNHVERYVIDEGHVAQRIERDYGYDMYLFTFDKEGYVEFQGDRSSTGKQSRECALAKRRQNFG